MHPLPKYSLNPNKNQHFPKCKTEQHNDKNFQNSKPCDERKQIVKEIDIISGRNQGKSVINKY